MLEVKAADGVAARNAAPVNLSLVIDRSGSMKGTRIRNAISAARSAVDRLDDGDVVSVVTFDTQTQVVVARDHHRARARASESTRPSAASAWAATPASRAGSRRGCGSSRRRAAR